MWISILRCLYNAFHGLSTRWISIGWWKKVTTGLNPAVDILRLSIARGFVRPARNWALWVEIDKNCRLYPESEKKIK